MTQPKILIVEDETVIAMELEERLAEMGCTVVGRASEAEAALEQAAATRPDVVLMDIYLAGPKDGIEAAEAIRARYAIPVIYLTAHADDATLERARLTGPFGYLLKPFRDHELQAAIEMAIYKHRMDSEVLEKQRFIERVTSTMPDIVYVFDLEQQRNVFVNREMLAVLGYGIDEVRQNKWSLSDLVHPDDWARMARASQEITGAEDGQMVEVEYRMLQADGTWRWLNTRNTVFSRAPDGHVTQFVGVAQDVTDRKQAAAELRQSERRFQRVVEHISDALVIDDALGNVVFVNDQFLALLGVEREDLPGVNLEDYVAPEWRATLRARRERQMDGKPVPAEYAYEAIRPDGRRLWLEVRVARILDDEGQFAGTQSTIRDITQRRQAEAALRASEARNRALLSAIPDLLFRVNKAGEFLDYQAPGNTNLFAPPETFLGKRLAEVMPPHVAQPALAAIEESIQSRQLALFEYQLEAEGKRRFYEARTVPLPPDEALIIVRDVTERRQAEADLRVKDSALASAITGFAITGLDRKITYTNAAWLAMFGYEAPEQVVGTTPFDHSPQPAEVAAVLDSMLAHGQWVGEVLGRRRDGSTFDLQLAVNLVRNEAGDPICLLAAFLDISERKRAERLILTLNRAALSMQKATRPDELFAAVAAELKQVGLDCAIFAADESRRRLMPRHTSYGESALRAVEGLTGLQLASFAIPVESAPAFSQPILEGQTVFVEDLTGTVRQVLPGPIKRLAEAVTRLLHVPKTINAPLTVEGDVIGLFSVQADNLRASDAPTITAFAHQLAAAWRQAQLYEQARQEVAARREAEAKIRRLNQELEGRVAERTGQLEAANRALQQAKEQAERANAAKNEFLSRMSHELRTPLNAILGFAQLLEMAELEPRQQMGVKHILTGGQHLLTLINEVLDITRIEAGQLQVSPEPVDVNQVVAEALELMRPLAARKAVQLDLGPVPAQHVQADRQRFQQVLLNLLSNAIKYNREGGAVRVTGEERPGGRLRLQVSDTGPGIAPDLQARAFAPFDRLGAEQSPVEGTGLGLALAQRLMEAMGGAIGMTSAAGEGSTFWIELPVVDGPLEQAQRNGLVRPAVPPAAGPAKTVLYLEDNLSNLTLMEEILAQRPTVRLLSAMQASLGLDLARQHPPDLILLDLNLPDLHGSEVLKQLQDDPRTRDIPVVVISADATSGQIERLLAAGARAYLAKPFAVKKFLETLDEVLQ